MKPTEKQIDKAKQVLKDAGYLATMWHKDDIRGQALDDENAEPLTDQEVDEVAERLEKYHDANQGINWEVIDYHINEVINERK